MLSIEKRRELLKNTGENLPDEQIEKLRGELYQLANIDLDQYNEQEEKANPPLN